MRFANQTAWISGGATGIGWAVASRFSAEGAQVVIVGRRKDIGEAAASTLRAQGRQALFVQADVYEEDQVVHAVNVATEHFGQINILVNNAAMFQPVDIVQSESLQWKKVFETIAYGTYYTTKTIANQMIQNQIQGSIINVSSINSSRALAQSSHYNSAKGALDQFTRCSAVELAEYGIRVNSVNPGFIDTPMSIVDGENELESSWFQEIYVKKRKIAQARAGLPEEVANVIVFLASKEASYICGATIPVDGGLSITF